MHRFAPLFGVTTKTHQFVSCLIIIIIEVRRHEVDESADLDLEESLNLICGHMPSSLFILRTALNRHRSRLFLIIIECTQIQPVRSSGWSNYRT